MKHVVVMEARTGSRTVWAWCTVTTGPGFDSIAFTATDGITPVDPPREHQLGKHIFTVLVDVEPAEEPTT